MPGLTRTYKVEEDWAEHRGRSSSSNNNTLLVRRESAAACGHGNQAAGWGWLLASVAVVGGWRGDGGRVVGGCAAIGR